ncbi:MAG: tetratricopeptide repeat protein [Verrucomicrobia bacterium]|nr:tetratricopeptide repeat protein [Verrucomicrobiota bacterium]
MYLWFGILIAEGQASMEGLTFKDALIACIQAVSSGDLETAAELFSTLETTFGDEEEYQSNEAQSKLLPLKGLSELGAGRYVEAALTLDRLHSAFPQTLQNNPSLLYGLAQAQRGAGNLEKAREVLTLYVNRFSGTVEAGLAFLERADLFFQDNLIEEGLTALDKFYESNAPGSLKMQGQLKAIQACLDNSRLDGALQRMLETRWSVTTMPELAQLAFSALRCGEFAMTQGNYSEALRLFQMVPPKSQLIRLQQEKLNELSNRILSGRRRALLSSNRHQQTYLTNMQRQLTQQLQALEAAKDYTPTYYLHYGNCLLLDTQYYKSWLVFEYISLNANYPQTIREEAHYRWVVCAHQLGDWEEALTIARNFVDRYPESKLAPLALYLIAKAHLEQRRYPESIEVLTDLINRFHEHPLYGRWLFTRGFNQVVLENYSEARADFGRYTEAFAQGRLVINAKLWNALTYFFEKKYSVCMEQLSALLDLDSRHPLYPEVLYRLASAHYAAREYDPAFEIIEDYLEKFERHQRADEARVLKGDIAMGRGELEEAVLSFKAVNLESPDLFLYGVFQVGKILRALEDYDAMVIHFQSFIEDPDSPRVRVSEALYWLGWAHQQQGQVDLAFPVFEEALKLFGNDPNAAETGSILQALEKLKKYQASVPVDHLSSLVRAADFKEWLTIEMDRAKQNNSHTYLSRLVLYYNNRFPADGSKVFPVLRLADAVPMKKLDPEALGRVGLALLDQKDGRAEVYFAFLAETYSRSNARAMAYLGLARLAFGQRNFSTAKNWLTKSTDQVPVHPHMNETQLLLGTVLSQLNEYEPSIETFERLLRLKSARGRPHATALKGIAKAHENQGNHEKAIAYYQRIYIMYRAYPDLVSSAYWASAGLFESMEKIPEAVNTLQEMLGQSQLAEFPEWVSAQEKLQILLLLVPEEIEPLEAIIPND